MNRRPPEMTPLRDQTPDQRAADLATMPLFAGFGREDLLYVAQRAEPLSFSPGMVIIRQGEISDDVNYLYIVGEGTLLQTGTGSDGIPWLDRRLKRGDVFGRYTLFMGIPQETTVTAQDYGYLYRIPAVDVSLLLTRFPQLQERLIPEDRIRRLRGLPLFSALPDDHLRRLADHVVEKWLNPGELYRRALEAPPHIWVVAEGQVILAPADGAEPPHFEVAQPLSLDLATVGYVFADGDIPALRRSPQQVRAVSRVLLYGLSAETFRALLERFEPPGDAYGSAILAYTRLPDVPSLLARVPAFRRLPDEWRTHLRGFVGWIHTPRGQILVQQGRPGHAMYLLERGEAVIRAEDERGRRRPRSYVLPGQAFGRSALLHGTHHDATLEATQPSCWLYLSRVDLDRFDHYTMPDEPELRRQRWRCRWHALVETLRAWLQGRRPHPCPGAWRSVWALLGGIAVAEEERIRRSLDWREPDEELIWMDRRHVFYFLVPFVPVAFLTAAAMSITLLSWQEGFPGPIRGLSLAALVFFLALCVYLIVDYLNDFYAITDRRIVHNERIVLVFNSWEEIPLDRVQDVIQTRGLGDRLLGTGTVIVQSAAEQGSIVIAHIPDPTRIRTLVMELRARTRAKRHAWRRERLREDLQQRLYVQIRARWPRVVTGEAYPERVRDPRERARRQKALTNASPSRRPWRERIWARVPRPIRWLLNGVVRLLGYLNPLRGRGPRRGLHIPWQPITHWQADGWLYWRKHPFNLLRRLAPPLLFLVGVGLLVGVAFTRLFPDPEGYAAWRTGITLAAVVLGAGGLIWLVWRYDDWRNDIYILTPDRIIDLEMRPFFLAEERREAPLSQVQTVRMDRRGLLQNLLNYGDVVIQTAAAGGDLTFERVVNPAHVVREINRYLEEFRRRQEEAEYERQQALIAESLEVYDELIRGRLPRLGRRWRREDL